MMEEDKNQFREELEELKTSIAELGYVVEETPEGELKVSEGENK